MADYTSACIDLLTAVGHNPIQQWIVRKQVSVSENGKTYSLPLNPPKDSAVYQIDGEIISVGKKCDKLVAVLDNQFGASIFVELKGKDVAHAIDQLESTLNHEYFKTNKNNKDVVRARIVTCGSGPTSTSSKIVTDAKIRFLKKYNCELRILKSRQPDIPL